MADVILKGGHVFDPANGIDGKATVAITDGKVSAYRPDLEDTHRVIDVSGLYVTPGLIDIHVHVYGGFRGWLFIYKMLPAVLSSRHPLERELAYRWPGFRKFLPVVANLFISSIWII